MKNILSALEARVIGCLLEKEVSTPEQYPLSLNSLTLACNQKSNRDPLLALGEREVQEVVDGLMKRHLISDRSGYFGRVTKYRQLFCNTEFGSLKFSDQERGILCELLLRGPQTPGALRSRTARLCRFNDAAEVEAALQSLANHADGPFVMRLERAPGERELRYAQLCTGMPEIHERASPSAPALQPVEAEAAADDENAARIAALEVAVAELQREVAALQQRSAQAPSSLPPPSQPM